MRRDSEPQSNRNENQVENLSATEHAFLLTLVLVIAAVGSKTIELVDSGCVIENMPLF